ncbi:MAG: hypothetical protein AB8B52_04365 [Winogradskyella sp.]
MAFVIMMLGTGLDLYLLSHYEDRLQFIPILCISLLMLMMIVLFFLRTTLVKNVFKFVLIITALSGVYGSYLHLIANYEFEIEMQPTANNLDLFFESLSGALPALAPLSMVVLALIGYSYLILINKKQ